MQNSFLEKMSAQINGLWDVFGGIDETTRQRIEEIKAEARAKAEAQVRAKILENATSKKEENNDC